jgi:hypothetical protein
MGQRDRLVAHRPMTGAWKERAAVNRMTRLRSHRPWRFVSGAWPWRACSRRVGSWRNTERLNRDEPRGAQQNDVIETSRPPRAWAGDARAGAQAHFHCVRRLSGAGTASRSPTINQIVTRANARVQLRASQIKAHAQHAQSLNRSSAATIVREQRRGLCLGQPRQDEQGRCRIE